MSCPVLSLHVSGTSTPADVADFLGVPNVSATFRLQSRVVISDVGQIEVSVRAPWLNSSDYPASWAYVVELYSPLQLVQPTSLTRVGALQVSAFKEQRRFRSFL